jgi:hypothetical protein
MTMHRLNAERLAKVLRTLVEQMKLIGEMATFKDHDTKNLGEVLIRTVVSKNFGKLITMQRNLERS